MKSALYNEAVEILTANVKPVSAKDVQIEKLCGRVLASDIVATINVPPFARSPYDGYAFMSRDTEHIGKDCDNVRLKVIENIRAGQVPHVTVTEHTAVRLMTGSPIPEGADCVCKYEDTEFTEKEVVIKRQYKSGDNIVVAGEDIKKGSVAACAGTVVDPGIAGVISSQGILKAKVYRRIKAGVITTGDEVKNIGSALPKGMIYNSNRYIISAALEHYNAKISYTGHASDDRKSIRRHIEAALSKCDVIISTGGVSVGDYDLVPEVMADMGFEILVKNVAIKPGMACVYGIKEDRLMLALSGNPASALTNLQCVCSPALRKLAGYKRFDHDIIDMRMRATFENKSSNHRLLRGCISYENGTVCFENPKQQGNVVISSAAGTNAYIIVEPGCIVNVGESVKGFMI